MELSPIVMNHPNLSVMDSRISQTSCHNCSSSGVTCMVYGVGRTAKAVYYFAHSGMFFLGELGYGTIASCTCADHSHLQNLPGRGLQMVRSVEHAAAGIAQIVPFIGYILPKLVYVASNYMERVVVAMANDCVPRSWKEYFEMKQETKASFVISIIPLIANGKIGDLCDIERL